MPRKKNINKKVQGSQEYVPIRPFYKQSHLNIFQLPYVGNIEEKTSEIDSLILFHTKKTFNGFWWAGRKGERELNLGRAPNFLDPVIEDNFLLTIFFLGPHYHPKYISLTRL